MKRLLISLGIVFCLLQPCFADNEVTVDGVSVEPHLIQDEGVNVKPKSILNFVGAGVTAANSGNKTVVTINGGGAVSYAASDITTTTTSFNNNLSSADTTVQKALDTLDNLTILDTSSELMTVIGSGYVSTEVDPNAVLSNGRAGGQTIKGGTQASENLSFWTNATGTVGHYYFTDLTDNGFVKTASGTGVLSIDTSTYLTTESDPIFLGSDASSITSGDILNWNTAYGWGDWGGEGFITGVDVPANETDPIWSAASGNYLTVATAQSDYLTIASADAVYLTSEVDPTVDTSSEIMNILGNNTITLGTNTVGNYVATIADSGAGEVTVANSGTENAAITLALSSGITRDTEWDTSAELVAIIGSAYVATESDPLSLHLDQSTPQTFTGTGFTGNGLLKITSGTIGVTDNIGVHPTTTVVVASSTSRGKNEADFVCDGTADNVQIQSAINLLSATGGGCIKLLEGTYNISTSIEITTPHVRIEGCGGGSTILYLVDSANCDMFYVHPATLQVDFELSQIWLQGNNGNNTSGRGIYCTSNMKDVRLSNVVIYSFPGYAIEIGNPWGFVFTQGIIEFCSSDGIVLDSFAGGLDARIDHSKIISNTGNGITIGALSCNAKISNCHIDAGNGKSAIVLNSDMNVVEGNTFIDESHTCKGVYVAGDGNIVANNEFGNDGGTMVNSIYVASGADSTAVVNNLCLFSDGDRISDNGTNTFIMGYKGNYAAGAYTLTSPAFVTPALGTPASGILTNCTGTATALNIGGNAGTATTLATARAINGVDFNGSAPVTVPVNNANDATNADYFALFTSTQGGNYAALTSTGFKYHPSTGILTATGFSGPLTGNVTGNVSGSSGSCTGNAATVTNGVYTTSTVNALASSTSANLGTLLSDEVGSGKLEFNRKTTISIVNPNAVVTASVVVPIWNVTDAAITVDRIDVSTSSASYEAAGDLKWADARIGLGNAAVIETFDTSSGVRTDTSIASAAVAAGKFVYLSFDSAPSASMTDFVITITWHYT